MGSTVMEGKKKDARKKCGKKKRHLRLNMPELSSLTMPFLEGDTDGTDKDGIHKGEETCHSSSPTKGFFMRTPFNRPTSPMSAPVKPKVSPTASKSFFPYPPQQHSPPKATRRMSFSGIFRSTSKDSPSSNSTSPVSIKLFSRARRGKE